MWGELTNLAFYIIAICVFIAWGNIYTIALLLLRTVLYIGFLVMAVTNALVIHEQRMED
jgi:hypothetical protein